MADVLNTLKIYKGFHDLVTSDDVKYLFKAISDARLYIKNVYRHEIEKHSSVKVRLLKSIRFTFIVTNFLPEIVGPLHYVWSQRSRRKTLVGNY